jgi:hypothetical protein
VKTVYDLIRHRSTLEVICGNCDNSRVFNHRFLMPQFVAKHYLPALKFRCRRCGAARYRLRIVADSLGETPAPDAPFAPSCRKPSKRPLADEAAFEFGERAEMCDTRRHWASSFREIQSDFETQRLFRVRRRRCRSTV